MYIVYKKNQYKVTCGQSIPDDTPDGSNNTRGSDVDCHEGSRLVGREL